MALGRQLKHQHDVTVEAILQELVCAKEEEGLSLADLMDRTGMDRSSLSRFFNSSADPTLMTLNKVAGAMGRTLRISLVRDASLREETQASQ